LGLVAVTTRNVFMWRAGRQTWRHLVGVLPKIWEGKKRPKFGAISDNFPHRSQMSPERMDKTKIGKASDQLSPHRRWVNKVDELWYTNKKVIGFNVDSPKWTFSGDYRGRCPSDFYTHYKHLNCLPDKLAVYGSSWTLPHVSSFCFFWCVIVPLTGVIHQAICISICCFRSWCLASLLHMATSL